MIKIRQALRSSSAKIKKFFGKDEKSKKKSRKPSMFDRIIRQLLYSEHFIQKLSNSYPIRRTARFLIRTVYGTKSAILDNRRLTNFLRIFREEYQKAIKGK
ncbi:hypothetical protein Mgra_00005824 [Meloidogyne graminicola]|uniref:Uncharacterized protein n=1 Tax=Meloidogyne graminicola TaxID=189291 RepID=A0A8S9ZNB6_9BILA|nr:hypothetical protein Mgra_00005824 [Meloidogyne graminicola]